MNARSVRTRIAARQTTATEVLEQTMARVHERNPALGALPIVSEEHAAEAASALDERVGAGGWLGSLAGVNVTVKDLIATAGIRTTRGSALFRSWVPSVDPPVVERLRRADAIVIGKSATSELGWKAPTDSPLFGATRHPLDPERSPGGSSGGAAAAVAARLGHLAVGTDALGSTRLPAALCGVIGFKPAHGSIPIHPSVAAAPLVHLGLLARSIDEIEMGASVVCGPDPRDRASQCTVAERSPRLRAGRPPIALWDPDFAGEAICPDVRSALERAVSALEDAGWAIEPGAPVSSSYTQETNTIFDAALASQLSAALDSPMADELDPGLRDRAANAQHLRGREVIAALSAQRDAWLLVERSFSMADVALSPVTLFHSMDLDGTLRCGDGSAFSGSADPYATLRVYNLTGHPAISIPCGMGPTGLPIGLQIAGRSDADVLDAARVALSVFAAQGLAPADPAGRRAASRER